jgi:hypothetical protein
MPPSTPVYVRKQLSVTAAQNRQLKRRSQELGVSEAEVVRRALDAALVSGEADSTAHDRLVEDLLTNTRRLAQGRRLVGPFEREALYDDRGRSQS